jgi:hypothetical protein
MAQYKVLSDNCSLGEIGSVVDESKTEGFNVEALVEGGHLALVSAKVSKQDQKESDL